MCKGNKACGPCMAAAINKSNSKNSIMKKGLKQVGNLLEPMALGTLGFLLSSNVDKISTGKDSKGVPTTIGSSPWTSGGVKVAVALALPWAASHVSKKYVKEVSDFAIGVGISGLRNIASAIIPASWKPYLASPNYDRMKDFGVSGPGKAGVNRARKTA